MLENDSVDDDAASKNRTRLHDASTDALADVVALPVTLIAPIAVTVDSALKEPSP